MPPANDHDRIDIQVLNRTLEYDDIYTLECCEEQLIAAQQPKYCPFCQREL